jgi:hypothetical protein
MTGVSMRETVFVGIAPTGGISLAWVTNLTVVFIRKNIAELAPYIEGYARTGQWQRAVELTLQAYQTWENASLLMCDVWAQIHQATAPDPQAENAYSQIRSTLQCTAP